MFSTFICYFHSANNSLFLKFFTRMVKSKELIEEDLFGLFKEFETLIVLEQHDKVSKLSSKICISLIELIDEESSEIDNDEKVAEVATRATRFSTTKDFIQNLCNSIFQLGKIGAAYAEVREFVRIRDLVCFSKLVGAIPDKNHEDQLIIDLECLSRILRQSIFLLRCINETSSEEFLEENHKARYDLWLDKSYTNSLRLQSHSFPVYCIDDINKSLVKLNRVSRSNKLILDQLNSYERSIDTTGSGSCLEYTFSSNWFKEFIDENLSKGYPLSRFTILVSIWIIAVDCNHKVLEQLISELIDRIYHEEANSNSEEELLQLIQVGSFWVTYYKKHEANIRQVNSIDPTQNEDGDKSSFDDDDVTSVDSSVELPSSNSSISLFRGLVRRINVDDGNDDDIIDETLRDYEEGSKSIVDLRSKLRHLIDDELLHGVRCSICSYKPSELFEPLNTSFCPKCFNLNPVERCSISFRPLELICLNSLMNFKPNINKLILVSPNEWARYVIAPKLATLRIGLRLATVSGSDELKEGEEVDQRQRHKQKQVGEHVVVAENYERLTVIRGDINQFRQKVESSGEDSKDFEDGESSKTSSLSSSPPSRVSSSSSSSSPSTSSFKNYEDESKLARISKKRRKKKLTGNQKTDGDTYISTLKNYVKVRLRMKQDKSIRIGHTNSSSLSETIEMFKMVSVSSKQLESSAANTCLLPVCLTDLLIMDTSHDGNMFKIALVRSNKKLPESGSLWSCSNRSSISGLRLGCGSVFASLELTRLGLQRANNEFSCPHCECQPLIRLRKLNEEL